MSATRGTHTKFTQLFERPVDRISINSKTGTASRHPRQHRDVRRLFNGNQDSTLTWTSPDLSSAQRRCVRMQSYSPRRPAVCLCAIVVIADFGPSANFPRQVLQTRCSITRPPIQTVANMTGTGDHLFTVWILMRSRPSQFDFSMAYQGQGPGGGTILTSENALLCIFPVHLTYRSLRLYSNKSRAPAAVIAHSYLCLRPSSWFQRLRQI
jgi:hypothetical protein